MRLEVRAGGDPWKRESGREANRESQQGPAGKRVLQEQT